MKMRKIMTAILTLTLTFSIITNVLASGNEITSSGGKKTTDIRATYNVGNGTTTPAYYVDVTWGNMEFVYHGGNVKVWDPENLIYKEQPEGTGSQTGWGPVTDAANIIRVENHSNVPVKAVLSYEAAEGYGDIGGTFNNKDSLFLGSAEYLTENEAPPSDTTELNLEGELSGDTTMSTEIGNVKVKISDVQTIGVRESLNGNPFMTLYQQGENIYVGTVKLTNKEGEKPEFTLFFETGGYKFYSVANSSIELGVAAMLGKTSGDAPPASSMKINITSAGERTYQFKVDINKRMMTITEVEV